jgi:hypothetical protein
MQIGLLLSLTNVGLWAGGAQEEDASVVTWDSSADTYTQAIFTEDASVVTWDSSADTYTQSTYGA